MGEAVMVLAAGAGVFAVLDTQQADTAWAKPNDVASAKWAVDFVGERAEAHATSNASYSPQRAAPGSTGAVSTAPPGVLQLADGTWRLIVPDQRTAQMIAGRVSQQAEHSREKITAVFHNLQTSRDMAKDLTRGGGVGGNPQMVALRAPNGVRVEIVERDANGNATKLSVSVL